MKIKSTKKCAAKKAVAKKTVVKTVEAKKPDAKCAAKKCCRKAAAKDVTFTFHGDAGKAVYIAGEFNGWDPAAKKLAYKARQGLYTVTLKLAAGTYQYKFVVDGTWCADPENANFVPNDQGTFNSVIEVK